MARKQDKTLNIRVSAEWLDALDAWIARQEVPPARTQVVMTAVSKFIGREDAATGIASREEKGAGQPIEVLEAYPQPSAEGKAP